MLLVIYVRQDYVDLVTEVTTESIGSGILGMIGNKGAVAVRFRFKDSYLTFVNCHLAADKSMVSRRNQDYQTISKKLGFDISDYYLDSHEYYINNPWVASFFDNAPTLSRHVTTCETFIPFTSHSNSKYLSLFDTE